MIFSLQSKVYLNIIIIIMAYFLHPADTVVTLSNNDWEKNTSVTLAASEYKTID